MMREVTPHSIVLHHPTYNLATGWNVTRVVDGDEGSIIFLRANNGARHQQSYPRFLMECTLQRVLTKKELVWHRNNCKYDNAPDNLIVKNRDVGVDAQKKERSHDNAIAAAHDLRPRAVRFRARSDRPARAT